MNLGVMVRRRGVPRRAPRRLEPLIWLGPSLLLIIGVVAYPVFEMIRTSFADISRGGVERGYVGLDNYLLLLREPLLPSVFVQTVVWVVVIVALTTLISLAIAQLANTRFPGRLVVRLALIVPWAASVVVTMAVWKWMLNPVFGIVNLFLTGVGLTDQPINFIGDLDTSFQTLMFLTVFVSVPFTVYVILAGLQTIDGDLYEAARVDGASGARTYMSIVLPLLRPALAVSTVLNVIFTFNSFTVIWVLTRGGPGTTTDITATFAYKLAFQSRAIGEAAALGVLNFVFLMIATLLYVAYLTRSETT